ncbi:titin homolog isoform X2 [Drosophila innubila]|uniref:titin homolog isoform X2 n=1 Tax=Drosophila innubila TaxID=198719 RepID=UPI00148DACF8|nr:titin homolog isoform X2 [Drosophila innubila]
MCSRTEGPTYISHKENELSVSENTIKSESDLTPGELYHSNSECVTNENSLDNKSQKIIRAQFKIDKRNKKADNFNRKPKSKGDGKASKPKNMYLKTDSKPSKIIKSKSEIDMLDEGNSAGTSQLKTVRPKKKISNKTDLNPEEIRTSNPETGKFEEQSAGEMLNQTNSQNDIKIKAETHLTPGELYKSQSEGGLYNSQSEGGFYEAKKKTRPLRKTRKEIDFKSKKLRNRFELNQEIGTKRLRKKKTQSKTTVKAKSNSTPSDHISKKSDKLGTKKLNKENIEQDSKISNESEFKPDKLNLKSEDSLSEVRRTSEVPEAKSRGDIQEENLKRAKLYISKAKRLHDIAKKKSIERKRRMRSGKGQKSKNKKSRKSKKSDEKMTLSEFLYGLVVNKDNDKKGGGNRRNFATFSAVRCSNSISQSWSPKNRKVHRYISKSYSWNKEKNNVFISPEVVKQGLGSEAIKKERKANERKKKSSNSKASRNSANEKGLSNSFTVSKEHTKAWDEKIKMDGDSHTTIRGGSLKEQKHMRRLNNITGKNERLDIQIGRGSPEVKERSRNDQINHNNKRSFNTLSQHIWKRIRYFFPDSTKISRKPN